jgi:hypothetical protein
MRDGERAVARSAPAPDVLRTLHEVNDGTLGVLAEVVRTGVVRRGDRLRRLGLAR